MGVRQRHRLGLDDGWRGGGSGGGGWGLLTSPRETARVGVGGGAGPPGSLPAPFAPPPAPDGGCRLGELGGEGAWLEARLIGWRVVGSTGGGAARRFFFFFFSSSSFLHGPARPRTLETS